MIIWNRFSAGSACAEPVINYQGIAGQARNDRVIKNCFSSSFCTFFRLYYRNFIANA